MTICETEVVVGQPPEIVAERWSALPTLAGRLGGVVVSPLSRLTSQWSVPVAAGRRLDLVVRVVGRTARDIVWSTTRGPEVSGRVTFRPFGDESTAVRLRFEVLPHGVVERVAVLAGVPQHAAGDFLQAFKKAVEDDRGVADPTEVQP